MHLLKHLKGEIPVDREVEYRLLCSGVMYPVMLGDSTKSDAARLLLDGRFPLINATCPPDGYPQELVLRFGTGPVPETIGDSTIETPRDAEIARDFAALLTLLCRRLITVTCKTREVYSNAKVCLPEPLRDFPTPFCTNIRVAYWKPRAVDVLYSRDGVAIRFNDPAPIPFPSAWIDQVLGVLPRLDPAESVIRAARLYATAMELIETRHELAYQLFVFAADTMAGSALKEWRPEPVEQLETYDELVKKIRDRTLSDQAAQSVVLDLKRDNPWSRRKFVKFLVDYVDADSLRVDDDLFLVPEWLLPAPEKLEQTLGDVYGIRSGFSHSGKEIPATANVGVSSWIPVDAAWQAGTKMKEGKTPFPPIGWFERVLQSAITRYLRTCVEEEAAP